MSDVELMSSGTTSSLRETCCLGDKLHWMPDDATPPRHHQSAVLNSTNAPKPAAYGEARRTASTKKSRKPWLLFHASYRGDLSTARRKTLRAKPTATPTNIRVSVLP